MLGAAARMTLSLFRFSKAHRVREIRARAIPSGACYWSLRAENLTIEGTVSDEASAFCVVGLFAEASDAIRTFEVRENLVPDAPDVVDVLHLLLIPTVHRGSLNWLDGANPGTAFRVETREGITGSILSMTTAGYDPGVVPSATRLQRFITNTVSVGAEMGCSNGLLFRRLFGPDEALGDAITISVWKSAESLASFAYGAGPHRERMVAHGGSPFFDRASFSRFMIDRAGGSWDGVNAYDLTD